KKEKGEQDEVLQEMGGQIHHDDRRLMACTGRAFRDLLWNPFHHQCVATGLAYLIGDRFVLPRYGHGIATIADSGLALASAWLLGSLLFTRPIALGMEVLISAVVTAIGEAFFHRYGGADVPSEPNLQTEFG